MWPYQAVKTLHFAIAILGQADVLESELAQLENDSSFLATVAQQIVYVCKFWQVT